MNTAIPKILGHIWIGPLPAPVQWMETWKEKHPDWNYVLYDNDFLNSFQFKTHRQIEEYLKRGEYAGAADLMRYEILYEYGGLIAPADSICYHNTDELWNKPCAYTVYENEFIRGKLVSPILACEPKNEFVKSLIEELIKIEPENLDDAWKSTGNLFVAQMIEKLSPDIIVFPSHYFIPVHFEGIVYSGNDKVYVKQLFGSYHNSYNVKKAKKKNIISKILDELYYRKKRRKERKEKLHYREMAKARANQRRIKLFDLDF